MNKKVKLLSFLFFICFTQICFALKGDLLKIYPFPEKIKLNKGWNLVGSYLNVDFDNLTMMNDLNNSKILSVWKWNDKNFQIYSSNSQILSLLSKYNMSKIKRIKAGEGFWVNTIEPVNIRLIGYLSSSTILNVLKDWQLVSFKEEEESVLIDKFNNYSNIDTIWKWFDNKWFAYSPISFVMYLLKYYGINTISKINSKEGFWINSLNSMNIDLFKDNLTINGSCGEANGKILDSMPVENLCSSGKAITPRDFGIEWKWICKGKGGGEYSLCSAKMSFKAFINMFSNHKRAIADIIRDDNNTLYILSTQIIDDTNYHIDPDGTKFYKSNIFITKIKNGEIITDKRIAILYTAGENNLSSSAIKRGAIHINKNGDIEVFISEKTNSNDYGQDGYIYIFNKDDLTLKNQTTLFTNANWGWYPYFDKDDNLWHFSYAGYYKVENTTPIENIQSQDFQLIMQRNKLKKINQQSLSDNLTKPMDWNKFARMFIDYITIEILKPHIPIADGGEYNTILKGESITLDGSKSNDPDGEIVKYEWKDANGNILCTEAKCTVSPDSTTIYTLTVTDNDGLTDNDSVVITVKENNIYTSFFLPDTGQTKCYDEDGNEIICPNKGEELYGQDANYIINPPKYTVKDINGDKVVIDENTKLMWMQGSADTNNDGEITYNDRSTWKEAVDYCENLNYAGYSDWRLPTLFELSTIVYYGTYNPAIDRIVFEYQSYYYWSSTTFVNIPDYARIVDFNYAYDSWNDKLKPYYIRCVRGEKIEQGPYVDNGDGTVTDKSTGLMWQKIDNKDTKTWKEALEYCENLILAGYDDWRLPNIQELRSIVKYDVYPPVIDKTVLECQSSIYWSSTTYAGSVVDAWNINFNNGNGSRGHKSFRHYFKCVRGGIN